MKMNFAPAAPRAMCCEQLTSPTIQFENASGELSLHAKSVGWPWSATRTPPIQNSVTPCCAARAQSAAFSPAEEIFARVPPCMQREARE
jgi:hypothetical protein